MIVAGWSQDVCPICGSGNRFGARIQKHFDATGGGTFYPIVFTDNVTAIPISIAADICMECGILYAYKCQEAKKANDATTEG